MLNKPLARCGFRIFTLAIMIGALAFLISTEKVQATEDCDTQYGYCIYNCVNLQGGDYAECRMNCEHSFEDCLADGGDPIPAPYPVVSDYSQCMDTCLDCLSLPAEDRYDCYSPCKSYCIATYAQ